MPTLDESRRSFWVWITRPQFYLDDTGAERRCLIPDPNQDHDFGWWTCHKETKTGDLALLYRTRPKSDIAYLLEAKSDARVLEEEPPPGAILDSQFQRMIDVACEENPALIEEADEIDKEVEELHRGEEEYAELLDSASTERDRVLRREFEELVSRVDRLYEELRATDLPLADQEDTNKQRNLDEAGSAVQRTQLITGLEQVLEEHSVYRSRAEVESDLFQRVFALGDLLDSQTEALQTRTSLFDAEVFRRSGLPESTVVVDDPPFAGRFVCDWVSRFKFERPLALKALKEDRFLSKEWGALRANFKGSAFGIPLQVWQYLTELASHGNPGLQDVLDAFEGARISPDIVSEKEIEDYLCSHLENLAPRYELELYTHPDGRSGRQFPCPDAGGFIDLLCVDSRKGEYVVIELKSKRAGRDVIGQIKSYMGWVKQKLAGGKPVRGLIISDGYDRKLRYALMDTPRIEHMDLSQIGAPRSGVSSSPKPPTQRLK